MTAGRDRFTLQRLLVAGQVALTLVLLAGSLLFVRSLRNLITLDAGFRRDGVLVIDYETRPLGFSAAQRLDLFRDIRRRLRAIPGVDSAADVSITPITGSGWNDYLLTDSARNAEKDRFVSNFNRVSPGYFRTIGQTLLAGRDFGDHDSASSPKVAIVDENLAEKAFHTKDVVGRHFKLLEGPAEPSPDFTIIGLVRNSKYDSLRKELKPTGYLCEAQDDHPDTAATAVVHSSIGLSGTVAAVREVFRTVNPRISLQTRSFPRMIDDSLRGETLMARLSSIFGLLALMLASVGLYGALSYIVVQRRNEIGIRIAIGADRAQVLRMVLGQSSVLVIIGLAAGIGVALLGGKVAESLLFNLKPNDPATLGTAALVLIVVAAVASYLPARRASNVEPMLALREE